MAQSATGLLSWRAMYTPKIIIAMKWIMFRNYQSDSCPLKIWFENLIFLKLAYFLKTSIFALKTLFLGQIFVLTYQLIVSQQKHSFVQIEISSS